MAEYGIRIENLAEIKAAFRASPQLMVKYLDRAIQASIFEIQRAADPYTPVLTGNLRANNSFIFAPARGEFVKNANYAIYVHDGTRFMKARPFLLEGIKDSEGKVQDNFRDAVQHVLDDIGRAV